MLCARYRASCRAPTACSCAHSACRPPKVTSLHLTVKLTQPNDYMTRHIAVEAAKGRRNLFPAHLDEQAVQQYIDTSYACYKSLTLPHERVAACRRQVFCVLCHQQRPHHDREGNDLRARQLLLWIGVQMRAPQLVCPESQIGQVALAVVI